MKRREFLKGALLGAWLWLTGATAARQAIGATPATESPNGAKAVYRYVWNESEKCYILTFVGYRYDT